MVQAPNENRPADLARRARRQWVFFAAFFLLCSIAALYGAGLYGRSVALAGLRQQGETDASLKVALLRAVLERPRALPLLLSRDRDLSDALAASGSAPRAALDRKLEDLVSGTGAAVIYVIDRKGVAIAASNFREPTSFVGRDYSFRPYFFRAMREGRAEHFALGSVSKRPGLYISQRIGPADNPLGVVVVKMEFDALEQAWQEADRPAYVVDANHVVLITSIPSWRFMTTENLPPEALSAIRDSLQFGEAPLARLPLSGEAGNGLMEALLPGGTRDFFLKVSQPVATTPWQFDYLLPTGKVLAAAAREARLAALLAVGLMALLAAFWLRRVQTASARIAREQAAREELERRVGERTRDLSLARDRLEAALSEKQATEIRLQAVQQDLVQANRLAILGQVAAGVAHEINQPLATIRAYADNARTFLKRQKAEKARENLDHISGLTERIATITEDLKALARKGRMGEEPVRVEDAIEGATLLLRSRFTGRLDQLVMAGGSRGLSVHANRLRLEQVLINLFQNALEAIEGRADGRVEVQVEDEGERVAISVSDNGPGLPAAIADHLFEPFNTSKEKGLGLGLVIAKDIVADYGGTLDVESSDRGAVFRISLRKVSE